MSRGRDALKPAYLIYGEDRVTVRRWIRRLAARITEEGGLQPERFAAGETPADEVVEACQALAMAGVRGVIVESPEQWRAADAAVIAGYLDHPNATTCLLLAGDKAPARRIVEAVRAVGQVEVAGPDLSGSPSKRRKARNAWLAGHARSEAERLGAELPPPVARFLVERVAEERTDGVSGVLDIAGEVGKLVAYAGGEPIDEQMVRVVTPEHPGARTFEFVDAITAGDAPRALGLLQDMASGAHPVSPERIQVALARHFRAVRRAQALGPSPPPDEVSEVTGLSGWPATKVAKQASALAPPVVSSALIRTAALELDLRVGSLRHVGRKPDDGERLILERASRDLLDTFRRDDP